MINSVIKALSILTELSNKKNTPVTLKELSEKLDINYSTCCHIIKTLVEKGFVERVSHHDGYILGPETFYLSRHGRYHKVAI